MNRTYEDMSKKELVTLVKRLAMQHDDWMYRFAAARDEAKQLREQVEFFKGLVDHYKGELLKATEVIE